MKITYRISTLLFFSLIFLKSSIVSSIITSFPKIEAVYSLSNFYLGLIIAVFYSFSLVFIFIWVYLIEKSAKFNIVFMGTLLWILDTILIGFSFSYAHLLVSAVIIGIGIESTSIAFVIYIFKKADVNKIGINFSIFIALQGLGGLFGVLITSIFTEIFLLEWNMVFFFLGTVSLFLVLVLFIFMKYFKIDLIPEEDYLEKAGYSFKFKSFKKVLEKKTNKHVFLISAYFTMFIPFFNLWLQKYFQEVHGLSQIEASIAYLFLSGGEFLGMIAGGYFLDNLHSKQHYKKIYFTIKCLILSFPFFIIGFLIPWKIPNNFESNNLVDISFNLLSIALRDTRILTCFIFLFLGFCVFSTVNPLIFILVNDFNDEKDKSAMFGVINCVINIGHISAPLIGGLLADMFSFQLVLILPAFVLLFMSIHFILIKNQLFDDYQMKNNNLIEQE